MMAVNDGNRREEVGMGKAETTHIPKQNGLDPGLFLSTRARVCSSCGKP